MPVSRLYQPAELVANSELVLDKNASHYLSRVLRVKAGDEIILFNGLGGEYNAIIEQVGKNQVLVKIGKFVERDVESPLNLHLAQGLARGEKMDYIIQKAVELGVKKITPLLTERSTVKLDQDRREKRLEHWQAIVVSACEQCGRNRLPEIVQPVRLDSWISDLSSSSKKFVLSPHVAEKLSNKLVPDQEVILLIGPEGGFSDLEMELAVKHDFQPLNLGPRVLRTETASVAAMSVLQSQFGDLR